MTRLSLWNKRIISATPQTPIISNMFVIQALYPDYMMTKNYGWGRVPIPLLVKVRN